MQNLRLAPDSNQKRQDFQLSHRHIGRNVGAVVTGVWPMAVYNPCTEVGPHKIGLGATLAPTVLGIIQAAGVGAKERARQPGRHRQEPMRPAG